MNKLPQSIKLVSIFFITFIVFILKRIPPPVLGSLADSTPQAYLPVMLKLSTPSPDVTQIATAPTTTFCPTATPTSTLGPTATPTATAIATEDWLGYVNWLRSLGGLPAVHENTDWSHGDMLHARYMVKNDYIGHDEDPANFWYTPEGDEAAASSNVMVSGYVNTTDIYAIDLWMRGPFHGVGIIDPALTETAYGSYREDDGGYAMGAALDVIRGLGSIPVTITFPIMWPINGGNMPYTTFDGYEAPDPLTSCSGYTTPSGPPIYLQIGNGNQVPNVTSYSFRQGSTNLESCEFDETNYTNPNSSYQSLGRSVLNMRDAIVIMPRDYLTYDLTYTVLITNSGTTYTWSFTVSGTQILSLPNAEIR
jgi:uncharacterized protein YkwD